MKGQIARRAMELGGFPVPIGVRRGGPQYDMIGRANSGHLWPLLSEARLIAAMRKIDPDLAHMIESLAPVYLVGEKDMTMPDICTECQIELTPEIRVDIKEFKDLCYLCYKKKPKHVCVDFDGVLAEYAGWKGPDHLGDPRTAVAHFLKSITDLGFKIIVLTTRDPERVYAWLVKNDLHHFIDRVTREKPPALVYLDDRAVCFRGNFVEAWAAIKHFVPYWKLP